MKSGGHRRLRHPASSVLTGLTCPARRAELARELDARNAEGSPAGMQERELR